MRSTLSRYNLINGPLPQTPSRPRLHLKFCSSSWPQKWWKVTAYMTASCFSLRRLKRITVSQVGLSYVYDVSLFAYTKSWDLVIFTSGKLMFRSPFWLDIPDQLHLSDLGNIPQPCMSRTSSVGDSSFPIVLDYGFPRPWPWLLPCRRGSAREDFSHWQVVSLIGNLTNGDGHGTCHP